MFEEPPRGNCAWLCATALPIEESIGQPVQNVLTTVHVWAHLWFAIMANNPTAHYGPAVLRPLLPPNPL